MRKIILVVLVGLLELPTITYGDEVLAIDGKLTDLDSLYLDQSTGIYATGSNIKEKTYFIEPFFLPKESKFKSDVENICLKNKEKNKKYLVKLEFKLKNKSLREEATLFLKNNYNKLINKFDVQFMPLVDLNLKYYFNNGNNVDIWSFPSDSSLYYPPRNMDYPSKSIATIVDTCENLREISNNIDGFILSRRSKYKVFTTNKISVLLGKYKNISQFKDFFNKESERGKRIIENKSKTGGVMFNIPKFLSVGENKKKSSTTIVDDRKRAISSKLIQESIINAEKNLKIITETYVGSSLNTNEIVKKLTSIVLESAKEFETELILKEDGFHLKYGTEDRVIDSTTGEYLISHKNDTDSKIKSSSNEGFKYAGIEAKSDKKSLLAYTDKNDIHWEKKNNEWIPTTIKLWEFKDEKLSLSVKAIYEQIVIENEDAIRRSELLTVNIDKTSSSNIIDKLKEIEGFIYSSKYSEGTLKPIGLINNGLAFRYSTTFPVDVKDVSSAILHVTSSSANRTKGTGSVSYQQTNTNIKIDGNLCASDSSYESNDSSYNEPHTSSTCIIKLSKGVHNVEINEYVSYEVENRLRRYSWSLTPYIK